MSFSRYPLGTQLTMVFLLVFLAAVSAFGIYDYHNRINSIKTANLNNILALSNSISASISEDIYSENFSNIEHKLLSLDQIREIDSATVYDSSGIILSEVNRNTAGKLTPTYRYSGTASKTLEKYIGYDASDHLTTRLPVSFSGQEIAWLQLKSNPDVIQANTIDILQELISFSLIILLITSLTIIIFLKLRLRPLHKLAEFSKKLPTAHGSSIELHDIPHEFKLLKDSLSWASQEIQKQHDELKRQNQTLESRIQERTRESEQARETAEKASQAKTEFLSRMSHELRTPLNAILGFAQLLDMEKNSLSKEQAESVNEIMVAGQHLLSMVNEVLELARIESGKYEINMQTHSVESIIEEALSLLAPLASADNISIIHDTDPTNPHQINCDRLRAKQVLLNIISNAIKYNKPDGSIQIALRELQDNIVISIKDTGEGIEENEIERIFKPFERSESSSVIEGTGIGLAISNELMKAMGGSIQVESVPGVGSTFSLFFQAQQ